MPFTPTYLFEAVNRAEDLCQIKDVILKYLPDFGFGSFVFHMICGDLNFPKLILLTNYPDEWISRYRAQSYVYSDLVHMHANTVITPFKWNDIQKMVKGYKSKLIFDEAAVFNIKDGISIPTRGLHNTYSVFSAIPEGSKAEREETLNRNYGEISIFAQLIHIRAEQLLQNLSVLLNPKSSPQLNAREKEILKWVMAGKTYAEIAVILGISISTVSYHMQNSAQKLGTTRGYRAAVVAMQEGLIQPIRA